MAMPACHAPDYLRRGLLTVSVVGFTDLTVDGLLAVGGPGAAPPELALRLVAPELTRWGGGAGAGAGPDLLADLCAPARAPLAPAAQKGGGFAPLPNLLSAACVGAPLLRVECLLAAPAEEGEGHDDSQGAGGASGNTDDAGELLCFVGDADTAVLPDPVAAIVGTIPCTRALSFCLSARARALPRRDIHPSNFYIRGAGDGLTCAGGDQALPCIARPKELRQGHLSGSRGRRAWGRARVE